MSSTWPPPGHRFVYTVQERFEGYELDYQMSLPSALADVDMSTLRVGRIGGPVEADHRFRRELFCRLGAITAAAGEVEVAMKRVLLLLIGKTGSFRTVDDVWSKLDKRLRREATGTDDRRKRVAEVLDWGEANRVKERRDNAIHASWWLYDGVGVRRSRFFHGTDGTTMPGSLEQLDEDARVLFGYAERLDGVLGSDWSQAMLPPLPDG